MRFGYHSKFNFKEEKQWGTELSSRKLCSISVTGHVNAMKLKDERQKRVLRGMLLPVKSHVQKLTRKSENRIVRPDYISTCWNASYKLSENC
jgi:hypothetical protein